MLGSRMFYARIDGIIYGFDAKRHRDNCGGEPVSSKTAYKEKYKTVPYWAYDNWKRSKDDN